MKFILSLILIMVCQTNSISITKKSATTSKVPLCTYVIESQPENQQNGLERQRPVIHPEFGCVSCQIEVQKECQEVPEVTCTERGHNIKARQPLPGRRCDPCPAHPINITKEVISCQNIGPDDTYKRPKRRIEFETKCREYHPPCGPEETCEPQMVCYQKPKAPRLRRQVQDENKICKKRIVVKRRRPTTCPCQRGGVRLPPRRSPSLTQRQICKTITSERCEERQVQVCDKLPPESCQSEEESHLVLKCTETVDIPSVHLYFD